MREAQLKKWAEEIYSAIEEATPFESINDNEVYYLWSKVAQMLLIDLANWHFEDLFPEKYMS